MNVSLETWRTSLIERLDQCPLRELLEDGCIEVIVLWTLAWVGAAALVGGVGGE